jgi:hypothetical protein
MTTTASKFFLGAGVIAIVCAVAYGWGTDGGLTGSLFLGLAGGVGELAGYTVLMSTGLSLLAVGTATSILRDADPEVQAAVARLDVAPPAVAPASPSYLPVLAAFTVVLAGVGLVASPVLFVMGALGTLLVTLEWMVRAWSERATGDEELNRQIRNRLMLPIELPVAGALVILVLVVSFSRIFLTFDDRNLTSVVAILFGVVITAAAFFVAYRPKLSKDAIAIMLVIGALLAIGGGIIAAANGTREFEHHGEEHSEDAAEGAHE